MISSLSTSQVEAADAWLPLHFAAQGGHVEVIEVGKGSSFLGFGDQL